MNKLINYYSKSSLMKDGNTIDTYILQLASDDERHLDFTNDNNERIVLNEDLHYTKYKIIDLKISKKNWDRCTDKSPTDYINKNLAFYYDQKGKLQSILVQ